MLFEELSKNKRIEEPEERRAEEIKRASKPKRKKSKFSSVSLQTVNRTLTFLGIIGALVILAGIVYVSYLGFNLYVNGWQNGEWNNMSKSLIAIINELHKAVSDFEKEKLSKLASSKIIEDSSQANSFLMPIVERISLSFSDTFGQITNSDFYELNIVPYFDVDNLMKISIRISFLQDFEQTEENLDEKILFKLVEEVAKRNLDLLVNDICINMTQYRTDT